MNKLEKKIVNECLARYNRNLAAIAIFGSYATGKFVEGISDIDSIIILKEKANFDLKEEQSRLRQELSEVNLSVQHFTTIKEYEEHIYEKASWSSWITIIDGSKVIYSTPEFKDFQQRLKKNPLEKKNLLKYVEEKDKFELKGYFKNAEAWDLTKALFSHIRRKIQIINYYSGYGANYDFLNCLKNINYSNKDELNRLNDAYQKRKILSKDQIKAYYSLAKELTQQIKGLLLL